MSLQENAVHLTADGRRLLVMHGDELDTVYKIWAGSRTWAMLATSF